jgi:HK97 family phage major capsid protein
MELQPMDTSALDRLHSRAVEIRASAEAERRNFTPAEVDELNRLFAVLDTGLDLIEQQPGQRRTSPGAIGRADPHDQDYYQPAYRARRQDDPSEWYALADGTRIRAYRPGERLSDANPRDAAPFNLARAACAAWTGDWRNAQYELKVMASQSGLAGASGEFLVPEALSREVVDLARAQSRAIQAGVRTIVMDEPVLKIAKVLSDPSVHWRPELYPIQPSSVTFGEVTLSAKTCGTYLAASEELLQDAANSDELFRRLMAEALAGEMDRVIFAGEGAGSVPQGILNNSSVGSVAINGKLTNYD